MCKFCEGNDVLQVVKENKSHGITKETILAIKNGTLTVTTVDKRRGVACGRVSADFKPMFCLICGEALFRIIRQCYLLFRADYWCSC